jgi:hypothetical protein
MDENKSFTMDDLIEFVLGWDYRCSFDAALDFIRSFANAHDIEIDVQQIEQRWHERTGH